MSSPILTTDSNGPFINDRYTNSFKANSTLAPGNVVKLVGSQTVDIVSQASDAVFGVVFNAAIAGRPVNVITRGIVKTTSTNATTAGDLLIAGAGGIFTDTGSSQFSLTTLPVSGSTYPFPRAIALETQATAGVYFLAAII